MSGENLTPITRKEMFIAKAAGQDVETPTPITREEMFLSKISGGGEVIEALTVSVTGECTPTEVADGYVIATVAIPTETYKNAEGVNF